MRRDIRPVNRDALDYEEESMNIVPGTWAPGHVSNRGGRHKAGNAGKKIDGYWDWVNGGRLFRRKTWTEREAELLLWITGKFTLFCYVCGQQKKSSHFDEKQIYFTFPWCLQCQQEDENDSLAR